MESKNTIKGKTLDKKKVISLHTHYGASVHAIAMRMRRTHDEIISVICESTMVLQKETETYIIIESKMNYSNNLNTLKL